MFPFHCSLNRLFKMLILITFYIHTNFKNWYCRIVTLSGPQLAHTIYNSHWDFKYGMEDLYWDFALCPDCLVNGILGIWLYAGGMLVCTH